MEASLGSVRILVVDDDPGVHRVLEDLLRFWGCEGVAAAADGHAGVEKYRSFQPHLVLMDVDMPVMNGYHASRAIVEMDPHAAIILLTGLPDSRLARRAVEQGLARIVIPKPFQFDQLRMAIEEALRERATPVRVRKGAGAVA
jgi:two-component system chemotaxis response regulator CheY